MKLLGLITGAFVSFNLFASVPIAPVELDVVQPDGHRFTVVPKGTINFEWIETLNGKAVRKVGDTWYYIEKDLLSPSNHLSKKVGSLSVAEINNLPSANELVKKPKIQMELNKQPHFDHRSFQHHNEHNHLHGVGHVSDPFVDQNIINSNDHIIPNYTAQSVSSPELINSPAIQNVLVILTSFNDQAFAYSDASFEELIFGDTGSVKDYFKKASFDYQTLVGANESQGVSNDGVVAVTLNMAHPNSKYGSTEMVHAAFAAADPFINYASYDANGDNSISPQELSIVLIVAGYENSYGGDTYAAQPRVWGHKWSVSSVNHDGVSLSPYTMFGERHGYQSDADAVPPTFHQATIGIMAHELGHLMLGLPDLYDTDGSSSGIGSWGLMGGGSWNSVSGYSGSTPAGMLAWSKEETGYLTIADATDNQAINIASSTQSNTALRIWADKYKLGEYFVLENRTQHDFDAGLANFGLLITHINEGQSTNRNDSNRLVDVEEADGSSSAGFNSVFPDGGSNFSDSTTPNSKTNNGDATNISVTNISLSNNVVTSDAISIMQSQGNFVTNVDSAYGSNFGYGSTSAWSAVKLENTTSVTMLDGLQVYVADSGTVDMYVYDSIDGGGNLGPMLASKLGNAVVQGSNRLFLDTPYSFPINSELVIVLKVTTSSYTYPLAIEFDSTSSGNSYARSGDNGAFSVINSAYGDFIQHALLSGSNDFDNDGIPDDTDTDDDNDGIPDAIEEANGLNSKDASDAALDSDNDGLTNLEEYQLGTQINGYDSDGDGVADGVDQEPLVKSRVYFIDSNQNKAPEVIVLAQKSNLQQILYFDTVSGTLVKAVPVPSWFVAQSLLIIADSNSNGVNDIAVLGGTSDNKKAWITFDGESGQLLKSLAFPSWFLPTKMSRVPDFSGNTKDELLVLGTTSDSKSVLMLNDSWVKNEISRIVFPRWYSPTSITVYPDSNGNNSAEVITQGISLDSRSTWMNYDLASKQLLKAVKQVSWLTIGEHEYLEDISSNTKDDFTWLAQTSDNKSLLRIEDSYTGALVNTYTFPSWYTPNKLSIAKSVGGNDQVVNMGVTTDSKSVWFSHDSLTLTQISSKVLPNWFTPRDIKSTNDLTDDKIEDLVVWGETSDDKTIILLFNSQTGAHLRTIQVPVGWSVLSW
jgi:M6 family metalloprotease-like protein